MFRLFTLLTSLLLASPVAAQIVGGGVSQVIGYGAIAFNVSASTSGLLTVDGVNAQVDLQCQSNLAYVQGQSGTVTSFVVDTRATTPTANQSTVVDASGNYSLVNDGVYRVSTAGCLTEEARQNGIRNSSMQGAVAGTPGTLPTNWAQAGTAGNLSSQVVGIGTENGINYIDYRVFGTPNQSNQWVLLFESTTQIPALNGQTWDDTVFVRVAGGSTNNITFGFRLSGSNSGGGGVEGNDFAFTPTTNALGSQRVFQALTLANGATAFITSGLLFNYTNGLPVDVTLRIGWPQLEQDNNAGAVASATVNTGGTGFTASQTGTATWTGSGCNPVPVLNVASNGLGVLSVTGINAGGLCGAGRTGSGLPPNTDSAHWSYSAAFAVTSPTSFNLVPVNAAPGAFATSPIRTSGSAVTRSDDNPFIYVSGFGAAITHYWNGLVYGATNVPANSFSNISDASIVGGTDSNASGMGSAAVGGAYNTTCGQLVGGSGVGGTPNFTINLNQNYKIACNSQVGPLAQVIGGTVVGTSTGTAMPVGTNSVGLGRHIHFQLPANEFVKRFTWWNFSASQAGMQTLTSGPP